MFFVQLRIAPPKPQNPYYQSRIFIDPNKCQGFNLFRFSVFILEKAKKNKQKKT